MPVSALLMSLAVGSHSGCGSNQNWEERARIADPKPYFVDEGTTCIGLCQKDPGPQVVDCVTPEQGLEFLRIWDFETPAGAPEAEGMYFYNDYTAITVPFYYQPAATPIVRCGSGNEHGFHAYGGPYQSWGGGLGRRVDGLRSAYCMDDPATDPDWCPTLESNPNVIDAVRNMSINLTQWEGVSFWARRGPDGQTGIRVAVGDQNVDDDVAFRMYNTDPNLPRFCERNRECGCRSENRHCNWFEDPNNGQLSAYYCWDPAVDPPPVQQDDLCDPLLTETCSTPLPPQPGPADGLGRGSANLRTQYKVCGETKCLADYAAFPGEPDRQFHTETAMGRVAKACTEFAFRGGLVDDYCFDPGVDPNPYEQIETCGDNWLAGVPLSTEWQFFKVPFTELLQQGWAKEFPALDLMHVSLVRFTWDKGWLDLWLDDVSFYRKARN